MCAKRVSIYVILLLLIPLWLFAADSNPVLPEGVKQINSVEGITEYEFSNGLKVLLFPDPTKQTITVNITYLVGSAHENYGETGMAHLLEHMLFRGTPKHPNIRKELTEHGARPNGTTWLDRTNYFETFAATEANLDWALDLEADRMMHSHVSKADLDQEMTVVRNEFEAGENSPQGVLFERVLATAYLWHNYGNTTIGARSDIENVPIERLQAFYKTYYQPDNAVLLIAGNFDPRKTLTLVHKYFSKIPRPTRTLPKFYTQEPVQDGERLVTLRRVGDVQVVMAAYHVPSGSHSDFPAIDVLSWILSDTPSGRLYKALVETKKATSVTGFNFQLRQPGVALYGAEVLKEASIDDARDTLVQTLETISNKPFTKEEVERAKTNLLKEIDLSLNSADRVGLQLSEWMAMGDWRLFFLHRDRLKQVTPEQVQQAAAKYLKSSNRTVGVFVPTAKPDRAEIPAEPNIAELLKDYKGSEEVSAGEAFDPSPMNIESRLARLQDPSGISMALLPKKTRGSSVVGAMTFRFGNPQSVKNRGTAGGIVGSMLLRGTTMRNRQQIQDELDRIKSRLSISGGATQASVSFETERANLPELLKLIREVLREPAFPANEFELLKQEELASIEQSRSEPETVANTRFYKHLSPYPKEDPRYVESPDETIAALKATTLEDVQRFYKEFYGASNAQFAVVGDFDSQEVSAQIKELFGDWKSPQPYERLREEYKKIAPINESLPTPDKTNAVFVAGMNLNIREDDPDYPALYFANHMLGGAMNSRLALRIREKEGLSYGVGSDIYAHPLDRSGSFEGYAIYAPENAAKVESAFREELDKAIKNGFTSDEINIAKTGLLQARQVSRAQDRELVRKLSSYLFLDRKMTWDQQFEEKLKALTPEIVTETFRKYILLDAMTIIKAGDFVNAPVK